MVKVSPLRIDSITQKLQISNIINHFIQFQEIIERSIILFSERMTAIHNKAKLPTIIRKVMVYQLKKICMRISEFLHPFYRKVIYFLFIHMFYLFNISGKHLPVSSKNKFRFYLSNKFSICNQTIYGYSHASDV